MKKLLIGGSPCTHWSIAQHNGRETEASGIGWELFKCYLAAKEKFKPDYFLYENNRSASEAIKEQISRELGAPLHYINSALVSAQNRQRFYVHNFGDIGQPADRGIVLDDILDSSEGEQFYKLAHVAKGASYCVACRGRYKEDGKIGQHLEPRTDRKTNTLTTVQKDNLIAQPIRLGDIKTGAQAHRVYSPYGKSVNITANGGGQGGKTGLYMCPIDLADYTLEKDAYHVVKDGKIETRYGAQEINLPDGAYVIRKLKPVECERLQTMPDGYTEGVADSQRYCSEAVELWDDVIPIAPHVYFTQFLDDTKQEERAAGMDMGLSLLAMCDELWVYGIENPSEGMRSEIEYAKQHQIPIRDAAELYRNREAETLPIGDALIVLPSHVGHLNGVAAIESTTVRINGEMILDLAIELRRHPGHDITLEADKGADSEVDQ